MLSFFGYSAGADGRGFPAGVTTVFVLETDHSDNSVGAIAKSRSRGGYRNCSVKQGDGTALGQGHDPGVLGVRPGSLTLADFSTSPNFSSVIYKMGKIDLPQQHGYENKVN